MSLPNLSDDAFGLLPPGTHPTSLDEVEQVFVVGAPYRGERELIWRSFTVWSERVWQLVPDATLWLNGGFITHKKWAPPKDVDVAIVAPRHTLVGVYAELLPLLTLQGVTAVEPPVALERVQPMSGHVDGFVAFEDHPQHTDYWRGIWSQVKDEDGVLVDGLTKGYAEVKRP